MTRKTGHISVLQFDENLISWLRAAHSGDRIQVLDSAVERGTWSVEDGSLEAALKEFVAAHKIAGDTLYTVLPRHSMTARILTLPSQDPSEFAGMVSLSASEFVPYAPEELVIDQCVIEKLADGAARILAVFAHRDIVEAHLQLMAGAGVEPQQVYLSSACMASAAIAARGDCSERYALINLASGGLEAVVIANGLLEYGRGIASSQDWGLQEGSAEEVVEELAVEVRASLSAYRRESDEALSPDALYLCSDWADVREPTELLTHETGYESSPAWFARDLVSPGVEKLPSLPLVALGAILTSKGRAAVNINLIPESVVRRRGRTATRNKAVKWAVLVALILLATGGRYMQSVQQRMRVIRELDTRITGIETNAKDVVSKQQQLEILQQQVDQEGSLLELLAALCNLAPQSKLNITRVTFEHGHELDIWGRAETLNEVNELAQGLRDLGKTTFAQFANARRLYEVQTRERNQTIYSYAVGIPFPEGENIEDEE